MLGGVGTEQGPEGQRPPATAVIVAAGSGERLGADLPKALVAVAGRPMYEWSLLAACAVSRVGAVVIAVPPGWERDFASATRERRHTVPVRVVAGGAVRSESVLRALDTVESDLVVVHDAARPMVESVLFDEALKCLEDDKELAGVVAATPVNDTIKRADMPAVGNSGLPTVTETLDRSALWAVQTPQAFRVDVLRAALEQPASLAAATDDAMLVEALGHRVAILPATPGNFKVTTPEDLARAEIALGSRPGLQP